MLILPWAHGMEITCSLGPICKRLEMLATNIQWWFLTMPKSGQKCVPSLRLTIIGCEVSLFPSPQHYHWDTYQECCCHGDEDKSTDSANRESQDRCTWSATANCGDDGKRSSMGCCRVHIKLVYKLKQWQGHTCMGAMAS